MENTKEVKPEELLLEKGEYEILAPNKEDISIDKIVLKGTNGSKRIWKLKELTPKQAIFDIIKFG